MSRRTVSILKDETGVIDEILKGGRLALKAGYLAQVRRNVEPFW